MNFTQKERTLLEDQKSHEEICIQKYSNYASLAQDPQLKSIFIQNGQVEQEHYNTIDQLLKGQMPQMKQSSSQGGESQQGSKSQNATMKMQMNSQQSGSQTQTNQTSFMPKSQTQNYCNSDKDLCSDLLMTEKYVSGAYNTAIFEFRDPQVRNILNHIQKEEQQHGETIFKYMESNGMYQVK